MPKKYSRSLILIIVLILAQSGWAGWELINPDAPWGKKEGFTLLGFGDELFAIGTSPARSVWRTSDVVQWSGSSGIGAHPNEHAPAVVHADHIWQIDGDRTIVSEDGIFWNTVCNYCGWEYNERYAAASFNGKLWRLGGYQQRPDDVEFADDTYFSDVYSFTTGSDQTEWTLVTNNAPWGARAFHSAVAFDDKLWLLGGTRGLEYTYQEMNDVWYTTDGENWVLATPNANWCPRWHHEVVVFRDRMWLMGGYDARQNPMNDVWSSADGIDWRLESAEAPWGKRANHALGVFQDKMYLMGGTSGKGFNDDYSDIWVYTPPEGEGEGDGEAGCEGEGEGASGPVPALNATPQFLVFLPGDTVEDIYIYNAAPNCSELEFTLSTETPWLSFSQASGTNRGCDDPVVVQVTSNYDGECYVNGSFTIISNGGNDMIGVNATIEFCSSDEGEYEGYYEGYYEGFSEGEGEGDGEGQPEAEGEGNPPPTHSADQNGDFNLSLSELLRVIQFFNSTGLGCDATSEDGYAPDNPNTTCTPHASDYNPQDWEITLSELLRAIQFYNSPGFTPCPDADPPTEDGYCPVVG